VLDLDTARAVALARIRATTGSRPCDAGDLLRAVLDDDRSDAALLLVHVGLDSSRCHAAAITVEAAVAAAASFARDLGDSHVRTDHLLVALLPPEHAVAARAAVAALAALPTYVPEPVGPAPRLPGRGSLIAFNGLLWIAVGAVMAAMAAMSPPDMAEWFLPFGIGLSVYGFLARLVTITTQRTVDRVMARIAAGQALVPVDAPITAAVLLAAGMHRVETHVRQPGGRSPSLVIVHGRVTWMGFERSMLAVRGAPYMVAFSAVLAARRAIQRRQSTATAAALLVVSWPLAWLFFSSTAERPFGLAVAPVVIGVLAGLLLHVGVRWWETFATIRTAAAWAGLPATNAWFDHELFHRMVARKRNARRPRGQLTQPPFGLRQRVWAGPAGVYRAHTRWHETISRAGGSRHQRKKWCDGAVLVDRWIAGPSVEELLRRLDAVPPGPERDAAELAVWFRGRHEPGPRTAERATEALNRSGVRATTIAEVVRRLSVPEPDGTAAPLLGSTP
jgi:hypothetical protein